MDRSKEKIKDLVTRKPVQMTMQSEDENFDEGEGNWLISYADLMTLLFAFFVLIAAFSTPDPAKFEKMKEETVKGMKAKYTSPYEDLAKAFRDILKQEKLEKQVSIQILDDGLELTSNGTLFFDSGSAELNPRAKFLVEKIAGVLVTQNPKQSGFHVVVEGHTDDTPIVSARFPSNWELSASRASTVVRLIESKGFNHSLLRPEGRADTEPVAPNRDANNLPIALNQAQNRRIVIKVQKQLPARTSTTVSPSSETNLEK